ncbi:hypothetical protein A2331_07025 [Candidatus Falkowbacteria bacterium RIFOXYB2_FULL_34_18]|uniref:Uncharacterized protein n=1 Tax=Candidatus Falkowbacteria bacterium RIFOXYD2_FULL_34_120 TaxID=1798007 RepID=A0A1F5TRJ2_9BACT|nr:MAG: hypothetical protein A2331_07025 [Candidatus Falkowbacteria bacterium RIFOXYB2_FULL_34_18]OGF29927.1 MAG: hypothetical protein A2500_03650 [Candidatus Falkowbacteria bacterium RIFOXYC12_FULL_34_55]OGF37215.1 MAG: hypothetical protein A2466_02865 [Candidatus Falkowbacteria bacterium RIFOXYC2_FULL_34_220]OGF39465.1 MAG: hypothetical protein A2515_04025 [Candidatus Falkowbacteria bacterium RIFOXYD12_FULL_34_57]OGF41553.1 MAG: hypothetical protein A2531_02580 [Candidatus Falkowbacteria bact
MKVLEDNNYIRVTCSKCKSILGVYARDIYYDDVGHYVGCSVICASCGTIIRIADKDIPSAWRSIIFDDGF